MVLEQLDIHIPKKKKKNRYYTSYKNKLKMDHGPQCKIENYKTPR